LQMRVLAINNAVPSRLIGARTFSRIRIILLRSDLPVRPVLIFNTGDAIISFAG
jgi:hypothetical protein